MNVPFGPRRAAQGGYALIAAILFMVLLTLIAVTAFRSSGLEAKMGTNNALHAQAFESSEVVRKQVEILVSAEVAAHGWPTSLSGGTVSTSLFDPAALALVAGTSGNCPSNHVASVYGFTLCTFGGNLPDWSSVNTECTVSGNCTTFTPAALDIDALYIQGASTAPGTVGSGGSNDIVGWMSVFRLSLGQNAGTGQSEGGCPSNQNCSGNGGASIYFYINGHGRDYTGAAQAGADTSTIYRDIAK